MENAGKFRDLIDSFPEIIAEIDLQGKVKFADLNNFVAFGYAREGFPQGLAPLLR